VGRAASRELHRLAAETPPRRVLVRLAASHSSRELWQTAVVAGSSETRDSSSSVQPRLITTPLRSQLQGEGRRGAGSMRERISQFLLLNLDAGCVLRERGISAAGLVHGILCTGEWAGRGGRCRCDSFAVYQYVCFSLSPG
jgi:hypothetical protein